jgi:multiple sugar transport system permease protein
VEYNANRFGAYKIISYIILAILAVLFLFPLYWIITGAFKTGADISAVDPVWWPSQWISDNFERLFSRRTAPLFEIGVPFSEIVTGRGIEITGPTVPAAIRWLCNTALMSALSMILTCVTATMAGYALAKKRFRGRTVLFSLIVCAMALPKQVILIPLLKEMSLLGMYDTLWAVIMPTVSWPFGVFMMKQFSEGIPGEVLEAARVDGSGELRTFITIVVPMVKPGIGALAIFTFINAWNDYFIQLIMLASGSNYTIALGIATMQAETSVDMGLLMAGAALAAAPTIAVFLIFQKYFTRGITMGAVKG